MPTVTMNRTLADRLEATGGRPSGFDYLRLGLSVAVLWHHSVATSYGPEANAAIWTGLWGPATRSILPMFFALSGFLVAGSMERSRTLIKFLGLRFLRVYPALAVEVLLSGLLIGAVATSLPLEQYFTDPVFFRYLLNMTGHISFVLPGVFETNPKPDMVNFQLWTVPYELLCYVVLGGLIALGAKRWKILLPLGAAGVLALILLKTGYRTGWTFPTGWGVVQGPLLVFSFLAGVSLYLYKDRVIWSPALATAGLVIAWLCFAVVPNGEFPAVILLCYVTVVLGLGNPPRIGLIRGADYSYGIYLYGYVIQQFVMWAWPASREWYWNIAICLPLTAAFAALSWHWVEKPALGLRIYADRLEDFYLAAARRWGRGQ